MTHIDIYYQIIEYRKQNPLSEDEYGENHHIKPKSIYPELKNDINNIVRLTAAEHFICHYHLWKHYKDELKNGIWSSKMACAFIKMKKHIIDKSEDIEELANLYSNVRTEISMSLSGKNNPFYGKHHSEETRKKISEKQKGTKHHLYGKKRSSETRKKISNALIGNKSTTGYHWYNNGIKTVYTFECPDGFVKGRLKNGKTTSI